MATRSRGAPKARLPLNRDKVLRAALKLADRGGIESLSMRVLGRELGVEAMSLYNHVSSKEDVLDGLADIVIGEIDVPERGDDWKPAMRRRAISVREMLARHPWAGGVIESRSNASPARSRYPEAVIGSLREAGFSIEMAIRAFFMVDSYVYGFAVQEHSLPSGTPDELASIADTMVGALPAQEYPYLHEVLVEYVLKSGFDYAKEFEVGLDVILDALDRARAAA